MTDSRMKSADDLIVAVEREQLGKTAIQTQKQEPVEKPEIEEDTSRDPKDKPAEEETEAEKEPAKEKEPEESKDTKTSDESSEEGDTDEYGNTIAKERVYTQDEVNRMIRERLARGKQQVEQPVEPPVQAQQPTEEPEEWQQQLKSEIKNTINEVKQQEQEKAWRAQQVEEQEAYQEKFTQGMVKYNDFDNVVTGKPITASMMMATKAMQDPAAFVYAACKNAPDELTRIAKIADPHIQIAEMARLEERMKKPRVNTNAPKPSRKISGDASSEMPKHSIDSLIATHAHEKIIKTRRLK